MRFKAPKNSERFFWTNHVFGKMIFYGLSEQRVKRAISNPDRIEEGIAPNTVACMQVSGSEKHRQEIWVMLQKRGPAQTTRRTAQTKNNFPRKSALSPLKSATVKIISAWRYPGKSPAKNPIPREILDEIKNLV
ncbi:MAG: hypothetical protein Q8N22_01845 [bacterium]|nr:hypothetical protein [bacterium]